MAEIEFKRRGTPLWAVVLVLIVIAGIVWALVGRGRPTAATADTAAAHTGTTAVAAMPSTDSARSAAAASVGVPTTAPASATGPAAQFAAWVDSTKVPGAGRSPSYIGKGMQLMAGALQERVPLAGAQITTLRAMADTLMMPNLTPGQYLNATQAGFFMVAYALKNTSGGLPMNEQAAMLQLTKPLAQQSEQVRSFFVIAADVLKAPIKGQALPQSSPPPPSGPVNPVPPSQRDAKPAPAPQTKG